MLQFENWHLIKTVTPEILAMPEITIRYLPIKFAIFSNWIAPSPQIFPRRLMRSLDSPWFLADSPKMVALCFGILEVSVLKG